MPYIKTYLHYFVNSLYALIGKITLLCWVFIFIKLGSMKTPQQLSREAIEEFKAAYKDEFGEVLSDDEVREIATRLLRFFGILSKEK